MALHRYGGGASAEAVARLLRMPFHMLVRLIGAAKRATTIDKKDGRARRHPSAPADEAEIIKLLDKKAAEARAAAAAAT